MYSEMNGEFVTWTVELRVHKSWVADGFDINCVDDIVDILADRLPYAERSELDGELIKKPSPKLIRDLQEG